MGSMSGRTLGRTTMHGSQSRCHSTTATRLAAAVGVMCTLRKAIRLSWLYISTHRQQVRTEPHCCAPHHATDVLHLHCIAPRSSDAIILFRAAPCFVWHCSAPWCVACTWKWCARHHVELHGLVEGKNNTPYIYNCIFTSAPISARSRL